MRLSYRNHKIAVISAALASSIAISTTVSAAAAPTPSETYLSQIAGSSKNATQLLQQISDNTYNTLTAINNIPTYLGNLFQLATSWLTLDDPSKDPSSMIVKTQPNFYGVGYQYINNMNIQNAQSSNTMANVLGVPASDFSAGGMLGSSPFPKILISLPYVNDLAYSSMLGMPPAQMGGFDPFNYVNYASGMNLHHVIPVPDWQGSDKDKTKYKNFFNTMVAIQSFNAYQLSNLAANSKNGNQLTQVQNNLINQASDAGWLATIGTEELGKVLRHILLFESQNYVVMTQLVQAQRDLLTAQIMTNTLLMSNNTLESLMVTKAKGEKPDASSL